MMKCPRCGFTQPRDQYCAQCGVDVSSYKPPTPPLLTRLAQSNLFQLGLVGAVIFLVASYVMKKKDHTLAERVNYLKGTLQISSQKPVSTPPATTTANLSPPPPSTKSLENTTPAPDVAASTAMLAAKTAAPSADSSTPAGRAHSEATTKPKSTDRSADASAEIKVQHSVKISYYEISNRVRNLIFEESRSTGQFNMYGSDYAAGLLNQFHQRLPSLGKDAILLHSDTKTLGAENFAQWFLGGTVSPNPDTSAGFLNTLQLVEIEPNFFRVNFELIKNWKETDGNNSAMTKTSYPMQVEMLKTSACFIWGILSPNTPIDRDDNISSIPPFNILKSRNFLIKESQLLILIEIGK